ncbi:MAG TPA: glutamine amidotransferase, partial [Rhodobacteraceae bacterium]|nr:glutamine amidotransferase [Paracoccaceae bacterium]
TTQHHPEMSPGFIADLTEELAPHMGPDLTARARASLADRAHGGPFAESVARFFEQAAA